MDAVEEHPVAFRRRKDDQILETFVGTSTMKALGGAAAVALTIVGLARIYPQTLLAIAVIAAGTALVFEGGTLSARYARQLPTARGGYRTVELGGGLTAEFFGGATGIALGILALVNIVPAVLLPVAAINFGATFLLGTGAAARINSMGAVRRRVTGEMEDLVQEAGSAAAATNALVGVGAVTLGILALIGVGIPGILTLVAILGVGFAALMSGTVVSGTVAEAFRH